MWGAWDSRWQTGTQTHCRQGVLVVNKATIVMLCVTIAGALYVILSLAIRGAIANGKEAHYEWETSLNESGGGCFKRL